MKNSIYTLFFATVCGLISATILAGVGLSTQARRDANALAEKHRHVMQVLGLSTEGMSSAALEKEFKQKVKPDHVGDLQIYSVGSGGKMVTAVAFAGPGLWGPIEGYLALDPDLRTIHGITFYKQEETPGLGGEIGAQWFQQQFVGKKIIGPDGKPGIQLVGGGKASGDNQVDAISGATLTSDKVQAMLKKVMEEIVQSKELSANVH